MTKRIIQDFTQEELLGMIKPSFRAKQIYHWMYHKYASSFDEMKNLPKDLKEKIRRHVNVKDLEDKFQSDLTDIRNFKITNHLATGTSLDELSVDAFESGFSLVPIRSFVDHVIYYFSYLKHLIITLFFITHRNIILCGIRKSSRKFPGTC